MPGGFAAVYKVLSAFEESGRCRRGYFVDGLGAAQFGTAGAIDRLRTFAEPAGDGASGDAEREAKRPAVALAATDPANPYGAALAWPASTGATSESPGHRPGRKAGAVVVLVDGRLVLYVERGGRTLLTWSDDDDLLTAGRRRARRGRAPRRPRPAHRREGRRGASCSGPGPRRCVHALDSAGFVATPRGLRLRA